MRWLPPSRRPRVPYTVTRFLWLPKQLRRPGDAKWEWRWLETATWTRHPSAQYRSDWYDGRWDEVIL